MSATASPLLQVEDLQMHYPVDKGLLARLRGQRRVVRAVDGVSLQVERGKTLALVGESGCGKTTLGKAILRLHEPTAGAIRFDGVDITHQPHRQLLPLRRRIQMVFQDPMSSLNRRRTIGQILAAPLDVHGIARGAEREQLIDRALETVGLRAAYKNRYPHEFSGGQRQRVGIARTLVLRPDLVVLDEPVSALDVSIQAQILNLLLDLQQEQGLTYVMISHDLSIVKRISDEVAVMYLGSVMEQGAPGHVLEAPRHPYTRALLSAVPGQGLQRERIVLRGEIPSPLNPPTGCKFHTRCPAFIGDVCREVAPELVEVSGDHWVRCHLYPAS